MSTRRRDGAAGLVVSRDMRIAGKRLVVLDGFLTDAAAEKVHGLARRLPYDLRDIDSDKTAYSVHWIHEIGTAGTDDHVLYGPLIRLAHRYFPAKGLELARIHYNLHAYGDVQFPHQDAIEGATVLLYVNHRWQPSWMGETVFYEREDEPVAVVLPKPGRVVLFDGGIVHRAGVAQRECFEPRISLALKFVSTRMTARQRRARR